MFEEFKAERIAKAAWEIVDLGYNTSPEIKYRIVSKDGSYIGIYIEYGFRLKIALGDRLNGDRMTVLEAKRYRLSSGYGFTIDTFHAGEWGKKVIEVCKDLRTSRKLHKVRHFAPADKVEPAKVMKVSMF